MAGGPPFFVDNNALDYFEQQLKGAAGNEVRSLLLTAIEKGNVCAPFPIRSEYLDKSDPPIFDNDLDLKKIFQNKKDPTVAAEMAKLRKAYPKLAHRATTKRKEPGDPWLMANGKVTGGTVVTEEKGLGHAGKAAASLRKIPDACAVEKIDCCNGEYFLDWCRKTYV